METNIIHTLVLTILLLIPIGVLVYGIWDIHFNNDEKYLPEEKPGKIIPSDWPVSENDLKYQKAIEDGLVYFYCHVCGSYLRWSESKEVVDGYHILRCESCIQGYKREKKPAIIIKTNETNNA